MKNERKKENNNKRNDNNKKKKKKKKNTSWWIEEGNFVSYFNISNSNNFHGRDIQLNRRITRMIHINEITV